MQGPHTTLPIKTEKILMKLAVFLTLLIKLIARNESVREFIEVWSVVSLAFAPKYSTDFSELLELRARLNDSTPGTSEHDEALHELQNHMEAFITRIDYDYNLVDLKPNQVERLKEIFGGSAYRKLVEKRNGELDEPIRRNSAEEQATELTEQAAIEFMEQGELSPQELQQLQQMLGDTLEQLEQAADLTKEQVVEQFKQAADLTEEQAAELAEQGAELIKQNSINPTDLQRIQDGEVSYQELQQMLRDTLPQDVSRGNFIEGHEASIAIGLAPDTGPAPSTSDLVPGTDDISDGDLLEADLLHV